MSLFALLTALITASVPTIAVAATPPDPADPLVLDRIDAFLKAELREAGIPGLAVAIVSGDTVVFSRGYGVADGMGTAVTADTPFQLASLSKAFTAVSIMRLVEGGQVDLDARVTRYLPWFRVGTGDQAERITVRHLLNHTSGIPASAVEGSFADESQDAGALERRVRALAGVALGSEPGERYEYGNANYEVLGLIVQVASGAPFDQYVAEHIYRPLGMLHSHVLAGDAVADGASDGFYRWFGIWTAPYRTEYPRATGPAGVSFSSANDMARWVGFQLGRSPAAGVLEPASLEALHTRAVQYDERHWYGMGWVIRPLWEALDDPPESGPILEPVPDLVEHGGDWDTAHTYVGLVPEREFGIVLLSNINDRTMTTRYFYIELGLLNILSGKDPLEPRLFEPPIVRYGKPLLIGLLVLQLVAIAWTVVTVRRARSRRISSRFAIILGAGLALTVDAFVIYLLLAAAPQWYSASVIDVIRATPDVGPLMMLMLLLAVIWAPARTVALLWASRRREAGVPSGR